MRNHILLGIALAMGLIVLAFALGIGGQPSSGGDQVTLQQIHEDLLAISQQLQHLQNLGAIAIALSQIARELRFGLDIDCRCECECQP
jgi:hypothetical protein